MYELHPFSGAVAVSNESDTPTVEGESATEVRPESGPQDGGPPGAEWAVFPTSVLVWWWIMVHSIAHDGAHTSSAFNINHP